MQNWNYLYASVRGKGHIEENITCQDSCKVFENKRYTICIVSDGAGSCENSHIGSENVTQLANVHFTTLVEEMSLYDKRVHLTQEEWHRLSKKTLRAIRNDLERVSIQGYEFKSLACTIIVVIHLKNRILITHIGDGRAGYCNHKDVWAPMMTPYKGKYDNETVFITSNIWDDDDKLDVYIESNIIEGKLKAFCLLSDGCENASFECYKYSEELKIPIDINKPFKDFFHENVAYNIPNLVRANKTQKELNEIWESFLEEGNNVLLNERDDKTMILAVRMPDKKK